jgi:excisionase family DNA binding protein
VFELNNPQEVRQATASSSEPEREWLTYSQAGQIVGLSRGTLWKLISAGEVEAVRIGRAVRIRKKSLNAYMERSAEGFSAAETK